MNKKYEVYLSVKIEKALDKIPTHIARKLQGWIDDVEERGIIEVRKVPGFHDEPLKGGLHGSRSIRLNKAYRAIYIEEMGKIYITEVNKHEY
jgi:proteic killer suppression protein